VGSTSRRTDSTLVPALRARSSCRCPDNNLLGRYSFTASTPAAGALRPLRDPDAPELDEDDDGGQE